MTVSPLYDPEAADQAIARGREGLSRAEIASELGVSLATFAAWSAESPDFAEALERAETEARAWWDAQPRLALSSSKTFRASAWRQAMIQRYGSGAPRQSHETEPDAAPAEPAIRITIPHNNREADPNA